MSDVLDVPTSAEEQVNEEARVWKKNAPFLYDDVLTHILEWPSLTVQWLPKYQRSSDKRFVTQGLLLGTHTSETDRNLLMVVDVRLPNTDAAALASMGGAGANGGVEAGDDECGGYGTTAAGKLDIIATMVHEGEVNRARYQPQNSFIIASKTTSGDVLVFDYRKHGVAGPDAVCSPSLRLVGLEDDGYGLCWSPLVAGRLLSCSNGGHIALWDTATTGTTVKPLNLYSSHTDIVEDVAWHFHHKDLFGSVGDDKRLLLWDQRSPASPRADFKAHDAEANCLSFSPFQEFQLLTGSADQTVALWDLRNLSSKVHSFVSHTKEVFQVQWSPFNETVFASTGADGRVLVWDIARIGAEQTSDEAVAGPAELMFNHAGHSSRVSDISWNTNDDWTMASVAEDNSLHIWRMAEHVYDAGGTINEPKDVELE